MHGRSRGKDSYACRYGDAHFVEVVGVILPVDRRARGAGIREPVERDIIKHLIVRELLLCVCLQNSDD